VIRRLHRWLNRREMLRVSKLYTSEHGIPVKDLIRYHDLMAIEIATREPYTDKLDRLLGISLATARALDKLPHE